jgi:hypothetical protein
MSVPIENTVRHGRFFVCPKPFARKNTAPGFPKAVQ